MTTAWSADSLAAAALAGAALVGTTAALARPAPPADRVTREGGTFFLPGRIMQAGYGLAAPVIRWAAAARVAPDAITWAGTVPGLAAGFALALGWPGCAACLLALSGLADLLDGAVARATGRATPAGAALDSVLDRYVEFAVLAGQLWWFAGRPGLQLIAMTALLGSFLVTYSTAKAEALGVTPPRGWMKRPERLVWLIGGAVLAGLAPVAGWPAQTVLGTVTAIVAVFANLSAVLRLAALQRHLRGR